MLKRNAIILLLYALLPVACYGQTGQLIIEKGIRLSADSLDNQQLITSLNGFLSQAAKQNKENEFVVKENLPETSALLDEIKGMENGSGAEKKGFYRCYLTNVTQPDSSYKIVQFSYIGVDGSTSVLRASFKLQAVKSGDKYCFSSPLKISTKSWRMKNEGNFSFYYDAPIDFGKVNNYVKKANEFDKRLNSPGYETQIYFCGSLLNALELLGVEYKLDYNGLSQDSFSSFENNVSLHLIGGNISEPSVLDIHDLWHDRLHQVVPVAIINKPVDEACAYLYGGSWGISWPDILKKFKAFMGTGNDWLTAFNESKNFGDNDRYHLYVSYVIDALIVQQIEKEKGFGAVIELLSCGKKQAGDENFFQALDKITGINKSNFNARIQNLIDNNPVK